MKKIFENQEPLLDYNKMDDELGMLGIGDRGFVNVNPPYGSDDAFDDQFERRASELQRVPSSLKPVHIIPNKSGPWSGNNQLGNVLPFQDNAQNEQTILKLDEWGYPRVWTVHLEMEFDDTVSTTFEVVAKIVAGIGGNTIDFEVDWSRGASFSFAFNALNVIAKYSNTVDLPTDLRLGVNIGHYPLPGARPTRTFTNLLTVPGGTPLRLKIPKFAKYYRALSVTLAPQIPYQAGVEFTLLGSGTSGTVKYTFDGANYFAFNPTGKVPIPGGCEELVITNNGANLFQTTVEFELALGSGS